MGRHCSQLIINFVKKNEGIRLQLTHFHTIILFLHWNWSLITLFAWKNKPIYHLTYLTFATLIFGNTQYSKLGNGSIHAHRACVLLIHGYAHFCHFCWPQAHAHAHMHAHNLITSTPRHPPVERRKGTKQIDPFFREDTSASLLTNHLSTFRQSAPCVFVSLKIHT